MTAIKMKDENQKTKQCQVDIRQSNQIQRRMLIPNEGGKKKDVRDPIIPISKSCHG